MPPIESELELVRSVGQREVVDKVELALHVGGKYAFPDTSCTIGVLPNGLRGRWAVWPEDRGSRRRNRPKEVVVVLIARSRRAAPVGAKIIDLVGAKADGGTRGGRIGTCPVGSRLGKETNHAIGGRMVVAQEKVDVLS